MSAAPPTFWQSLGGTVVAPRRALRALAEHPDGVGHGLTAVLLVGVLYTLTVIGLAWAGVVPVVPPWIAIPAERYYFWEIFFTVPVFVLGWIVAGGLAQVVGRALGRTGTFESTLAVLGFALAVPTFVMWVPETIEAVLFVAGVTTQPEWMGLSSRGFWRVFRDAYQVVTLAWYLALLPLAIAAAHRLSWPRAVLAGAATVTVVRPVLFVVVR